VFKLCTTGGINVKSYPAQTLLLCVAIVSLYALIQIANLSVYQPDVQLMALALRATIAAQPTPTPHIIEIPIEIPVTVEVTRMVDSPQPTAPPQTEPTAQTEGTPIAISTPLPIEIKPTSESVAKKSATDPVVVAPVASVPLKSDDVVAAARSREVAAITCATTSSNAYTLIPMEAADTNHPDNQHGDLNLALRGYQPSDAAKELVTYTGDVDAGAPQLATTFADRRQAAITDVYQVRDWRWDCGEHGCATDWLTKYEVSLLGLATTPGEAIFFPYHEAEIYGGGYVGVVLYAEETRLTIAYTRDGTVANGYAVQLENLCVDPNLLRQYREGNGGGRQQLPGLHNGDAVGVAASGELLIAIRDRGMFMDPRSKHDWWH
jgi:hypothetical protein